MEPLSIATSCIGLLTGVSNLSMQISTFVSSVRDARKDMDAVSRELVSLSLCLSTLRDDSVKIPYPDSLRGNLLTVLRNCDMVIADITTLLQKLSSANLLRKIQWTAVSKSDINKLRSSLESHKSALEIGLDMTALLLISAVKDDVAEVKVDTTQIPSIKRDTSHIVQQISLLRQQIESGQLHDAKAQHLHAFLTQSTAYAESVMDSIDGEASSALPSETIVSENFSDNESIPIDAADLAKAKAPERVVERITETRSKLQNDAERAPRSTCLTMYDPASLQQDCMKPPTRRLVRLACPYSKCDTDRIRTWACFECNANVEYGYMDPFIYCDCGRSLYSKYRFRCSSRTHGLSFTRYDQQELYSLLQNLEPYNDRNILVLGENEVEKSTFVKAFINYLNFKSLGDALKHDLQWANIDDNANSHGGETKIGDEDSRLEGGQDRLTTSVHVITLGPITYRLIDAPSFGVAGYDQRCDLVDTFNALSCYENLHGVLILLRSNQIHLNADFRSGLGGFLQSLHKSYASTIVFGFTDSRSMNYTPGNADKPLKAMLKRYQTSGIFLSTQTMYCFDSEGFRYLTAQKSGFMLDNKADSIRSWDHSACEVQRLLDHFQTPHTTENIMALAQSRALVMTWMVPMVEMTKKLKKCIEMLEDNIEKLNAAIRRGADRQYLDLQMNHINLRESLDLWQLNFDTIMSTVAHLSLWLSNISVAPVKKQIMEYFDHRIEQVRTGVIPDIDIDDELAGLKYCEEAYVRTIADLETNFQADLEFQQCEHVPVHDLKEKLQNWEHLRQELIKSSTRASRSSSEELLFGSRTRSQVMKDEEQNLIDRSSRASKSTSEESLVGLTTDDKLRTEIRRVELEKQDLKNSSNKTCESRSEKSLDRRVVEDETRTGIRELKLSWGFRLTRRAES